MALSKAAYGNNAAYGSDAAKPGNCNPYTCTSFSDPHREIRYDTPTDREGVPMADLTMRQELLALRLLAQSLSLAAYRRAAVVMNERGS